MSFDEWFNSHEDRKEWDDAPPIAVDAFEVGQQSKQAEIDELQARIDKGIEYIEPSDELSHKAYRDLVNILKGNKDEN